MSYVLSIEYMLALSLDELFVLEQTAKISKEAHSNHGYLDEISSKPLEISQLRFTLQYLPAPQYSIRAPCYQICD